MAVVNSDSFRSLSIDQQLDIILADGPSLAGQTSDRVEQESLLDSRSTADQSFDPLLKQTVIQAIELSRSAQAAWSQQSVSSRLKVIASFGSKSLGIRVPGLWLSDGTI